MCVCTYIYICILHIYIQLYEKDESINPCMYIPMDISIHMYTCIYTYAHINVCEYNICAYSHYEAIVRKGALADVQVVSKALKQAASAVFGTQCRGSTKG